MVSPLCVELYCGSFGWSAGWLELGGRAIGVDLEHCPHHGPVPLGADLILQDVRTLHGAQFHDAALILCSPPCQFFSRMAMPFKCPWNREKFECRRNLALTLFWQCWRIQQEASEAKGEYIPMVVENVKGAQNWVGRAMANFGPYYLWGDVRRVGNRVVKAVAVPQFGMPAVAAERSQKFNPDGTEHGQRSWFKIADSKNRGSKNNGGSWFAIGSPGQSNLGKNPDGRKVPMYSDPRQNGGKGAHLTSPRENAERRQQIALQDGKHDGVKNGNDWFGSGEDCSEQRKHGSRSDSRKAASAAIARIPYPLSRHIAEVYFPS
jgi:hypothetical protein